MISFDPLWDTMKKRGISQYTLVKDYKFSAGKLDSLRNNKNVTTNTIDDLCKILNCEVHEIIRYIPDNRQVEK